MLRILLILLILAPVGLFAAGFRVHPENLPEYFQKQPAKMVRLDLVTGRSAVGELVTKNENMVIIKMAGTEVPFSPTQVLEMRDLTPEEIKLARENGLMLEKKKGPLWSYDKENSFFKKLDFVGALQDEQQRLGEQVEKNSPRKQELRLAQESQMQAAAEKRKIMQQMQAAQS